MTDKLRMTNEDTTESEIEDLYDFIQKTIIGPWEKRVRSRPPGTPIWWNPMMKEAQEKIGKAAKKWYKLRDEAKLWTDGGLDSKFQEAHTNLKLQQKDGETNRETGESEV